MSLLPLLAPEAKGTGALVASATLDGVVSAVIGARRWQPLRTVLFTPEGQTAAIFEAPALRSETGVRRLYALHLPVTPADLPALDAAIGAHGHADVLWADSHYLSAAGARFLQERGVRLIHDPAAGSTAELLLRFFGDAQPWEATLAAGLSQPLDQLAEPWRSWLLTFLAVLDDPYHVRHVLAPLVDSRFEAYDPALRAAGEERWQRILAYAESHVHQLDLTGQRLLTLGLPRGERSEYRLLLDALLREKQAALALTFFDEHPRLILRVRADRVPPDQWHRLGEHFAASRIGAYFYDRRTMFLDVGEPSRVAAIERVTTQLQAFFG